MAWYSTGTVSVTNGSRIVTGTGTSWFAALQVGWGFVGPDLGTYEIESVDNATQITLKTNYMGPTATAQSYKCFPTNSLEGDLATSIQALISDYQAVVDGPGAGRFDAGTVTEPGITFDVDRDTGFWRVASNILGISTGGSLRLRVDGDEIGGSAVTPGGSKLMSVGAFGLGSNISTAITDFNAAVVNGHFHCQDLSSASNAPTGWLTGPASIHVSGAMNAQNMTQRAVRLNGDGQIAVRTYRSGAWGAWHESYTANTLLGPVSESGGVPTGHVFDGGSNANGEYIAIADGTLICTNGNSAVVTAPATFVGPIIKVGSDKLWVGRWF